MKENISPPILIFVGTTKATIVNTVTQEPFLTSGKIRKIEGLVVDIVKQEPMSTEGQVEETAVDVVCT